MCCCLILLIFILFGIQFSYLLDQGFNSKYEYTLKKETGEKMKEKVTHTFSSTSILYTRVRKRGSKCVYVCKSGNQPRRHDPILCFAFYADSGDGYVTFICTGRSWKALRVMRSWVLLSIPPSFVETTRSTTVRQFWFPRSSVLESLWFIISATLFTNTTE